MGHVCPHPCGQNSGSKSKDGRCGGDTGARTGGWAQVAGGGRFRWWRSRETTNDGRRERGVFAQRGGGWRQKERKGARSGGRRRARAWKGQARDAAAAPVSLSLSLGSEPQGCPFIGSSFSKTVGGGQGGGLTERLEGGKGGGLTERQRAAQAGATPRANNGPAPGKPTDHQPRAGHAVRERGWVRRGDRGQGNRGTRRGGGGMGSGSAPRKRVGGGGGGSASVF